MIRRPPRSTPLYSSAASDVYKRQGTPGYLSPEVVEGAPVTEATDWWGWAATRAFAASGAPPLGRGPMDVVLDRVARGQGDFSGVDHRLVPLLQAALSPTPTERP